MIAILIFGVAACTASSAQDAANARYMDFGSERDGDKTSEIYLLPDYAFWGGWGGFKEYVRYENETGFWWATKPKDPAATISARVMKSWYAGEMRVKAFVTTPAQAYLAIRYKDNLAGPATVSVFNKGAFRPIGALGGKQDHAWKTAVFSIPGKDLEASNGEYRFNIGKSDSGDLMGDLPLDWMKLSTAPVAADPDKPGYYPRRVKSKFDDVAKTQVYREGAKPMFPVGVCVLGLRESSFRTFRAANLNSAMLLGWETPWGRSRRDYNDNRYSDRLSAGWSDLLDLAKDAGIFFLPCPATDTRSYFVQHQYKSEKKAVESIADGIGRNAKHPGVLAWFIKDEADHDDASWGSPEEFVQDVYNAQKLRDPDRPALVNFQGWKPNQYPRYIDAADIMGFDAYPIGRGESGRGIALFADRIRKEVAGRRAVWAIVEGFESEHFQKIGRKLTTAETVAQGYIAIAHGMQGVFFFFSNGEPFVDQTEHKEVWAGVKQFATEINGGPDSLESFLVPPAKRVVIADLDGANLASASEIHAALFEKPDGTQALVTVNEGNSQHRGVRIKWPGLPAGQKVRALFENRDLTSDASGLTDNFWPYERHVYLGSVPK